MDLSNKNILIVGLGDSGKAAALRAFELGGHVTAYDENDLPDSALSLIREKGIDVVLQNNDKSILKNIDLLIVSPGVPPHNLIIREAISERIPVISELEFAFRQTSSKIIAVTGTNGKSSTVTLISEILGASGIDCIIAGNIGLPFTEALKRASKDSIYVLEVSSFQLEFAPTFRPDIGIILNIAEDHIDWHETFDNYIKAKFKMFSNQNETDFALINIDDEVLSSSLRLFSDIKSRLITFGIDSEADYSVADSSIYFKNEKICSIAGLKLVGKHNIENVLASVAAANLVSANRSAMERAISDFKGLDHRISFVGEINGVKYYDDSKATNPHATLAALEAFDSPVILLLGGKNKDNDFDELVKKASIHAKDILLFGEAALSIAKFLPAWVKPKITKSLAQTVENVRALAKKGDVVLLSPACASFDEFNNYKERGEAFKEAVLGK